MTREKILKDENADDIDYSFLIERGIRPEKAHHNDRYCTIGFCEEDQKWYGWTFAKVCGFGIGYVVTNVSPIAINSDTDLFENPYLLPVGFKAENLEDCKRMAIAFTKTLFK